MDIRVRPLGLLVAGALIGAGLLLSLAPTVQKTYGALEVTNTWTAQQTFSGGAKVTGGTFTFPTCPGPAGGACSQTGQTCIYGTTLFTCNLATLTFVGVTTGSTGVLSLVPQINVPTSCAVGDMVMLTSGAMCHCYSANPAGWENIGSQGVCQ